MKIFSNGPDPSSRFNPTPGISPQLPSPEPSSPAETAPSDEVRLSHTLGSLMSALRDSSSQVAEQMEKISRLSASVSSGRYYVSAYLVSGSIIDHSLRFGATGDWALSI